MSDNSSPLVEPISGGAPVGGGMMMYGIVIVVVILIVWYGVRPALNKAKSMGFSIRDRFARLLRLQNDADKKQPVMPAVPASA